MKSSQGDAERWRRRYGVSGHGKRRQRRFFQMIGHAVEARHQVVDFRGLM